MGDEPQDELEGMTPLEAARTPFMDQLASNGILGLVETITPEQEPGSDVANMAIMGYDPDLFHSGRAPLEAASMGIELDDDEVAFRCNLVSVEPGEGGELTLVDYSAGHISNEEAHMLIQTLQEKLGDESFRFYPGVSYRHLLVWRGGRSDLNITPPHDVTGQPVAAYWRAYDEVPELNSLMGSGRLLLAEHPVNQERVKQGKRAANAIWLWGQGLAVRMPSLKERFGFEGVVISAVDLLKGLGVCAGLEPISVAGATGYLDTNYRGKVAATVAALRDRDFVYLHVEAPDETSHQGSLELKVEAIEAFDSQVVGPVLDGCRDFDKVRVLLITDHLTPVRIRTHAKGLVPFAICDLPIDPALAHRSFCEGSAASAGLVIKPGHTLMEQFIEGDLR
jgi:2,3-bisphosphoglycerate-independent phosphoglycerate mutase